MDERILTSSKLLCSGIISDYTHFDDQIMLYLNGIFMDLQQIGIGPAEGFSLLDENTTWDEFLPTDSPMRNQVKTYMAAKVKLQFDPPASATHLAALERIIAQSEWRLNVHAETPLLNGEEDENDIQY